MCGFMQGLGLYGIHNRAIHKDQIYGGFISGKGMLLYIRFINIGCFTLYGIICSIRKQSIKRALFGSGNLIQNFYFLGPVSKDIYQCFNIVG